jgi:hypothetical protein
MVGGSGSGSRSQGNKVHRYHVLENQAHIDQPFSLRRQAWYLATRPHLSHSIFPIPHLEGERNGGRERTTGQKEICISQVSARKKKEEDLRYLTYHATSLDIPLLVHPQSVISVPAAI